MSALAAWTDKLVAADESVVTVTRYAITVRRLTPPLPAEMPIRERYWDEVGW